VVHYLTFKPEYDAAVNITASHNPDIYNGLKMDYSDAFPLHGPDIQKVYELVVSEQFIEGEGFYEEKDLSDEYINHIGQSIKLENNLKTVINCGNGATSEIAPQVFEKVGADLVPIFCTYDSTFPHHIPNPEDPIFMKDLEKEVLRAGAKVGFGFDGDGDRLGVIDEKGDTHFIDRVVLLFAKEIVEKNPGATILYDVKCSQVVPETLEEWGGTARMIPTGRSGFLEEIMKGNADLGVEFSGHLFFKDKYFGFDDAIYAACRLLRIMDKKGKKLSELMDTIPRRVSTPELKVACPDDKKFDVVEKVAKQVYEDGKFKGVVKIDGVRASLSDASWFLVRASNTSPFLSIRAEGKDHKELDAALKEIVSLLSGFDFLDLSGVKV
jgi:phosphomannomutase/phosphoglucomutase